MAINFPPVISPAGPSPVTPPPQVGVEAQAQIKVREAVMLLADAVSSLKGKLDSDLGKAVLGALKTLAPVAPSVEKGLGQSEIASLIQNLKPVRPPEGEPNPMTGIRPPVPSPIM